MQTECTLTAVVRLELNQVVFFYPETPLDINLLIDLCALHKR